MKKMPVTLRRKLLRYGELVALANKAYEDITVFMEYYGVPIDHLDATADPYSEHPTTEALAFLSYAEGEVEENVADIENVFLHFVNLKK